MKTFREFVNEETMPFAQTEKGFVGIESPAVRDNINSLLAGVTDTEFITPYIALERVAKVLANFHIFLPKQTFLDSDRGMVTIEINQFGEKVGVTDNGEVVTQASSPYYLYFEYEVDDNGTFEVFSEVVTEDELDEILSDMDEDEEELDEEKDSEEKDDEEDDEEEDDDKEEKLDEACWEGYKQVGTKMKGGREVPNCVPLEEAVKKLIAKALKEAEGMHLDKPQKGKMASINKLNKEEKSGMPAWYEKEKSKSASLQAATKAKKKEQQKKTDYAIRNMKEEQLDEKLTDHQLYMNGAISRDEYEKRTGKGRYKKPDPKERYGVVNKNLVKTVKEEQLDELSQETKKSYVAKRGSQLSSMKYGSDRNNNSLTGRQQKNAVTGIKRAMKEENLDEQSKAKLAGYIKAASHDVAAKSAAVRGFARDAEAQRKDKKPMDARKSDERADKMFKKSWNRRQYIAKAVDKLTKEENINELSPATMSSYVRKSSERKAQDSADMSRIQTSGNPEGAALYKKMHRDVTNRSKGISRANAKLAKEENLPEAKDSYAAYQRRMGMNPEKAAKKEGEWSKQIKKQEKKAKPKK